MPRVNPDILRWARETAGLAEEDAAKKVGLNAARGFERAERMRMLELGQELPSRALLTTMAKVYRRPLLSFYLGAPPTPGERVEDFRTLAERRPESEPLVQALVRDVRARQALVQEVLEDGETPAHPFVGSVTMQAGPDSVAQAIVRDVGFSREVFRNAANVDGAFAYARERAERGGVFVLLIGDLGSHHTRSTPKRFRGFALADAVAPFVVINDRDAHSAWAFTLFHELAHLWLGASGVSGARAETEIERFCNDRRQPRAAAGRRGRALDLPDWSTTDELAVAVSALARPLKLSRTLLAFRLYQAGMFGEQRWVELRDHFRELWRAERDQRKAGRKPDARGGPNPHVVKRHHLGPALIALVSRAVSEGTLTATRRGGCLASARGT